MEVEGHHQVIDVGMEVVMVEAVAAVAAVVLVGADLVSHDILNFEVCIYGDTFFDIKNDWVCWMVFLFSVRQFTNLALSIACLSFLK
jgi:hypothetical protein